MSDKKYRITVRGLVEKDGKFLLLKRAKLARGEEGYWELVGGGQDFGESPVAALEREVAEETGLKVKVGKPLSVWDYLRPTEQIIGITFACDYVSGDVTLSDEHSDYAWLSLDEIKAKKIFPELLEELKRM